MCFFQNMQVYSTRELNLLPSVLFEQVYWALVKQGDILTKKARFHTDLLTTTDGIIEAIQNIFVNINEQCPCTYYMDEHGNGKVEKGVTWFVLERIFRRRFSDARRTDLIRLGEQDFKADPDCSNMLKSRRFYDYDIVYFIVRRLSADLPTRQNMLVLHSAFNAEKLHPGTTLTLEELKRCIVVIFPNAKFKRFFWWKVLGPLKESYTIYDLLNVIDHLMKNKKNRYAPFANHAAIEELQTVAALEQIMLRNVADRSA
jgi:hypothetical protein